MAENRVPAWVLCGLSVEFVHPKNDQKASKKHYELCTVKTKRHLICRSTFISISPLFFHFLCPICRNVIGTIFYSFPPLYTTELGFTFHYFSLGNAFLTNMNVEYSHASPSLLKVNGQRSATKTNHHRH